MRSSTQLLTKKETLRCWRTASRFSLRSVAGLIAKLVLIRIELPSSNTDYPCETPPASEIFQKIENKFMLRVCGNYASVPVIVKHKTSVAIDEKLLAAMKREAIRQDRSVSYLLNKLIEEKLSHVSEEPGEYVSYLLNKSARRKTKRAAR